MNTNNATALVPARNVVVGDKIEHLGTFFHVDAVHTPAPSFLSAVTGRSVEIMLAGYGLVSIPTINTVRVQR